jgi:Tol biopolymer transport system component
MSELRGVLERVRDQLVPPPGSFERLVAYRRRRHRRQRVAALALALVVAAAALAFLNRAFGGRTLLTPAANPSPLVVSNGVIAFGDGAAGIRTIEPDGSGLSVVDDSLAGEYGPDWSPDGTRIALYGYPPGPAGNDDIYVMDADGTGLRDLTTSPADVTSGSSERIPNWSPDGTKIAYQGEDGLYVVNADGSGQASKIANGGWASWSPDGTRIAFAGNDGVFVMNSDRTGLTQLTSGPADDFPAWSPDGTKIAFVRSPGSQATIYIMNADGTDQMKVAEVVQTGGSAPVWSPDGSKLAFDGLQNGSWDIYVVNADGTGFKDLTADPKSDENSPVWSPDGTKIAFEATNVLSSQAPPDNTGTFDIYVMNADGTGQTKLTTDAHALGGGLSWQPVPGPSTAASA